MKKTLFQIILATVFSIFINPSLAQEILIIDGVKVTKVTIAPARTPIARIIKVGLYDDYKSSKFESKQYYEKQKLYYFYGQRFFEPLWLTQDESGKPALSKKASQIIEVFKKSYLSGLNPSDYLNDAINIDEISANPADLANFETAFSASAMRYASDTYGGRINPRAVSKNIDYKPNRIDESKVLLQLVNSDNPSQVLLDLEPKHKEFLLLKKALANGLTANEKDLIIIPNGKIIRLGDIDKRIPLLRERFNIILPNVGGNIYDEGLLAEIEKFQTESGLSVDGIIGPATITAINGGNNATKEDIIANMERWRWLPRDLGRFNVFVNIPQYRLEINRDNKVVHSTRVVVGKPKFATPIFSDNIKHIVVNPYWNIPRSIMNNEIAPKVFANPSYLASQNMELLSGGKVVNATKIDWSSTSMNKFYIRQRPGPRNALGTVKFLFPNKHAVYLHDTPSKSLFSRSRRAFSHGCVRVKNPWDFTKALLQLEPKIKYASIRAQQTPNGKERWNNLAKTIPVHLTYFTLRINDNGDIRSYGDVYGHNKRLKKLLAI